MNVIIEERVLDEIFSQAKKDTDIEVIGLLLGSFEEDEMIIKDYLTGPSESSRIHASLSRDFLAKIAQKKIDGKLKGHILGWYHSHPDYGCFMSDRDIATQENIQNLYEDAIALVIDPVREESRLYRMTGGGYVEIPFSVKGNRKKENDKRNFKMPRLDSRKAGILLLILALLASDAAVFFLWSRNASLQENNQRLEGGYKRLYDSVNRTMILTDRFDSRLQEFAREVALSTSERLRNSFCNLLIIYLRNFKGGNTTTLENHYNQKNFNILMTEASSMLDRSPIVFGEENLLTLDVSIKELSRIMLEETDSKIVSSFANLFSLYLIDFKDMNTAPMEELQKRGDSKRAIAEGIKISNKRPTILLNSPLEGEKISGTYRVSWNALDADGTIESVSVEYRNIYEASWSMLAENGDALAGYYEWNTGLLSDGEYMVRITVADDVGEKAITESGIFSIKNQNNAPQLALLSPIDNQTIKGTTDIRWSASDVEGDIIKIRLEYSQDGGSTWKILAIVANTGSYIWDVTPLPTGNYILKVTADDSKGGINTVQVTIIITR